MKVDDIRAKVIEVLDAYLDDVEWDAIDPDTDLAGLGMDSMAFIQVVVDIEEQFDIEIPDEHLLAEEMGTIGGIIDIVLGALGGDV